MGKGDRDEHQLEIEKIQFFMLIFYLPFVIVTDGLLSSFFVDMVGIE